MAFGYNGLRACLGERRGRRELGPVDGNQEEGTTFASVTLDNPPVSPHPVPCSAEAQEITFHLRPIRDYGLVRLKLILRFHFTSDLAREGHVHENVNCAPEPPAHSLPPIADIPVTLATRCALRRRVFRCRWTSFKRGWFLVSTFQRIPNLCVYLFTLISHRFTSWLGL